MPLAPIDQMLVELVRDKPMHTGDIAHTLRMPPRRLLLRLMDLESEGRLRRDADRAWCWP